MLLMECLLLKVNNLRLMVYALLNYLLQFEIFGGMSSKRRIVLDPNNFYKQV
jgi:hypothetical protein